MRFGYPKRTRDEKEERETRTVASVCGEAHLELRRRSREAMKERRESRALKGPSD